MNNLIFVSHTIIIALTTVFATRLGVHFVISTLAVFGILANLFVLKQISLFGLEVTSADVFIVGISLGLNLLQEKFDKNTAQLAVWVSFWCLLVYTVLSQFQVWYLPNSLDTMHAYFLALFTLTPRLTIASLTSYLVSQTIDVNLYAHLKKYAKCSAIIRNFSTIAVSQLADTIIFSLLGLYGLGYHLMHIIVFSYCVKLMAITLAILVTTGLKKFIKL